MEENKVEAQDVCKKTTTLSNGAEMPLVGLGTWQAPAGEVEKAVQAALEIGYRHIDCAAVYGNEAEVGGVFEARIGSDPGQIARADVFVTSKLWNSEHAAKDVEPACRMTLDDLKLDYLDLYLIHWPQAFAKTEENAHINRSFPKNEDGSMQYDTTTLVETWRAMEALVEKGLVKAIGLSNFNSAQITEIMAEATIQPAVLQVENHPYYPQENLLDFCKSNNIVMTAYSPLGSGATLDGTTIPLNPTLKAIGGENKTAAQVAIAWQVQRGVVVIPKSVTRGRIALNLEVDFEVTEENMAAIKTLASDNRIGWGGPLVDRADGSKGPRDEAHPNYPFKQGSTF